MLQDFYTIEDTTRTEELNITKLLINKDHPVFNGHFPERPVTPGVILMKLFKDEAERRFNCRLRLIKAQNIKFVHVLDPSQNNEILLETKLNDEGGLINLQGVGKNDQGLIIRINAIYRKL